MLHGGRMELSIVNCVVTVINTKDKHNVVIICHQMAADLHLESKKKACLSFGNLKRYVNIILKEEVQYGDIVIAQKIIKSQAMLLRFLPISLLKTAIFSLIYHKNQMEQLILNANIF